MNIHFKIRAQGKLNPRIIVEVYNKRFKDRKFTYSTGIEINPSSWDKRKGRLKIIPTQPNWELALKINDKLDNIEKTITSFLIERFLDGHIERSDLKQVLEGNPIENTRNVDLEAKNEIFETWERLISTAKGKSGNPVTSATRKSKMQTLKLVKRFCHQKRTELSFTSIDTNFYNAFDSFMISIGLNGNSRGKHFKEIKAILREAEDRDIKVNKSYTKKSFKVIRGSSDSTYLTNKEIRSIFKLDLSPSLAEKRDLFVMACFLGLRHSDWNQIRNSNIIREGDKELLRIKQKKTGDIIHIPLHTAVRSILNKYNDNPPNVVTNQKFNAALKEIAKEAALGTITLNGEVVEKWKHISTHTARRSFATNAYLSRSMEVYQIMKCTGHRSESSFLKYLKLDGRDFAIQAAESKFFNDKNWNALRVA